MSDTEVRKPIIAIDFDGVIHQYRDGWKDGSIYDEAVPGFFSWAFKAREKFTLVIVSSRLQRYTDEQAMKAWLIIQGLAARERNEITWDQQADIISTFKFSSTKPPAFITIDDRALTFKGDWLSPIFAVDELLRFKPWNVGG